MENTNLDLNIPNLLGNMAEQIETNASHYKVSDHENEDERVLELVGEPLDIAYALDESRGIMLRAKAILESLEVFLKSLGR